MKNLFKKLTRMQWLAIALIILGAAIMFPRARGMLDFYKEARYAAENDFASGDVSPDLLRPWMSIRYVAVAYAVPQQYLFDAANIKPRKETSMVSIQRLNQKMGLGQVDGEPALLKTVRAAIAAYRADPVATGLLEKRVEGWMTAQYVANSTGIAVDAILAAANILANGNIHKPFDFLSEELNYPGGPKALVKAVQDFLEQEEQP